ncbi:hypothetical protein KIW84_073005, partial [Lathyrus oleraceus]
FDHVVVAIKELKDLSNMTKEELQGTLESHEQRMTKRTSSKSKTNVALHAQSIKERKENRRWNGNKVRRSYKYSTNRGTHKEDSSSNQRQSSNQVVAKSSKSLAVFFISFSLPSKSNHLKYGNASEIPNEPLR